MVNNIFTIERTRPQTFTYSFNENHYKKATGLLPCMKHFCQKDHSKTLKTKQNKTQRNRTEPEPERTEMKKRF